MSAPLDAAEIVRLAEWFDATLARVASLSREQRHADADRIVGPLLRLCSTIEHSGPMLGYAAELLFGDLIERARAL